LDRGGSERTGLKIDGLDRPQNWAIWQIMVFIATVLRCSHVQRAADTLLRCYADLVRRYRYGGADHITFALRFLYDFGDDVYISCISNIIFDILPYFKMNWRINADLFLTSAGTTVWLKYKNKLLPDKPRGMIGVG
jgi:hypothetical protein